MPEQQLFPYLPFLVSALVSMIFGGRILKERKKGIHHLAIWDIILSWLTYAFFLASLNYVVSSSYNISELFSNFTTALFDPYNYLSPLILIVIMLFIYNLLFSIVGLRLKKYDKRVY